MSVYLPIDVRRPIHPRTMDLYENFQLFFNMSQQRKYDFFSVLNPDESDLMTDLMIHNTHGRSYILHWLNKLSEEKKAMLESIYENKLTQPGVYGKKKRSMKRKSTKRKLMKRKSTKRR